MKKVQIDKLIKSEFFIKNYIKINKLHLLFFLILILVLWTINDFILISFFRHLKNKQIKSNLNKEIDINIDSNKVSETNIDFSDEFFKLEEVKEALKNYNLTYIKTISGYGGNIGNALIGLNNLINICINIKCKNIIIPPGGLSNIIKKPIYNKDYNLNIIPNSYKNKHKINIDIFLNYKSVFFFKYTNKNNEMRLSLIRDEVLNNIPKYDAGPDDLYINIRSGEIFIDVPHPLYSQPPLCFYQKIIKENKYKDIYILANGHENPVIDELLRIYPKIIYIHGSIEYDASVIINAFNFVMPASTFPMTLIWLNYNLKNLYIYKMMDYKYFETIDFNFRYTNYAIHIMKPSENYFNLMYKKWRNSKEQLDLMLKENCINSLFTTYLSMHNKRISLKY